MRRIPPLAAVRVFEAAARHLNFTSAAAELGMTQSAVSYQIRLLEERLGIELFTRRGKKVALTEEGRQAAALTAQAFDLLDTAFAPYQDGGGVLRVTAAISFATAWLAPRLGGFQVAHPDVALRLHSSNAVEDFASGFDVAIRTGRDPKAWPGTIAHFIHRVYFTPMCSPAFLDRVGPLTAPEQLLGLTRLASDDHWWDRWFTAAGVAPGDTAVPRTRLDSQSMEAALAMAGQGVALLTPPLWATELALGRLVQPFETVAFDGTCAWFVYPEPKRLLPRIRHFRDWLLAEFSGHADGDTTGAFVPPTA